ncbi:MAG: hypothetical protein KC493_01590 [Bacteriovoracaceae bacterium]|nr:hypothetical protein [Bacteriovoracaceae bacterium]
MSITKKYLLPLLILSLMTVTNTNIRAEESATNFKTVAVVVSITTKEISIPTIELFREVVTNIQNSSDWVPAPNWSVKNLLSKNQKEIPGIGAIPALDRAILTAAYPKISGDEQDKNTTGTKVLTPIQVMLDTLALEGAIIVDCVPKGQETVSSCALYYYDRAFGKIVAASSKSFLAGVSDSLKWAPTLLSSLTEGMKSVREKRSKAQLKNAFAKTKEETVDKATTGIELAVWGQSPGDDSDVTSSIPGLTLVVGKYNKGYSWGIDLSLAKTNEASSAKNIDYNSKSLGLVFQSRVNAAESLIWDLSFGAGYAKRSLVVNNLTLDTKNLVLKLSPGLLWKLNSSFNLGIGMIYERFFHIDEVQSNAGVKPILFDGSLKASIRLQTLF